MSTGRLGAGDTAIQPTIFDAKGDLLTATAGDTPARIAVGSNGQYLKVDSTTATGLAWATLPASGKVLQVVSATTTTQTTITSDTTYTDTTITATITPTSASSKVLILISGPTRMARTAANNGYSIRIMRDSTAIQTWNSHEYVNQNGVTQYVQFQIPAGQNYMDSPATTSAITYKLQAITTFLSSGGSVMFQPDNVLSSIVLMEIGA